MDRDVVYFVTGLVALLVTLICITMLLSSISCRSKARIMGVDYQWSVWTDCMIKDGDKWVPLKNYRDIRQ